MPRPALDTQARGLLLTPDGQGGNAGRVRGKDPRRRAAPVRRLAGGARRLP